MNRVFIVVYFIFCLVLIGGTETFAEKINVIAPSAEAQVFIDGQKIATGSVYQYESVPGSHYLQIYLHSEIVYQKVILVPQNETKTFDISGFVNRSSISNIPNAGPSKLEASRLRAIKGDVGVGFQVTPVMSGASVICNFDKIGIQAIGWSSRDYSAFGPRLLYRISDRLLGEDNLRTLYAGIGYGTARVNNGIDIFSYTEDRTLSQVFVGVELPWGSGFVNFELGYMGIQSSVPNNSISGMNLDFGYHFYF